MKREQSKEKKKRRFLYKKYGYLIKTELENIPLEHRCKLNGGLRCFRKLKREIDGEDKIVRCGNAASQGSLFCKRHGGGNTSALVTGKHAITSVMYAGAYKNDLSQVLISFLNDPCILDLKPELANARTLLRTYIDKLSNAKPKNPARFILICNSILNDKDTSSMDKYMAIKILVEEQASLMDGKAIDRINRTINTIGTTVERIHKLTNKNDFLLTPDGLKVILRSVVEVIKKSVIDEEVQKKIREELLKISTLTKGDLSNVETKPLTEEEKKNAIDVNVTETDNKDLR